MLLHRVILWIAFAICGVYDCIQDERHGNRICKPFLMPLLAIIYAVSTEQLEPLLLFALLAGGLGDFFLLKRRDPWWMLGLLAFLVGHNLYLPLFFKDISRFPPVAIAVVACYGVYGFLVLRPLLKVIKGKKRIAVILYACFIGFMSFSAFLRAMNLLSLDAFAVWAGTCLFCLSDTLILYRTFGNYGGAGVMETYLLAQVLITAGYIW